MSDPLPLLRRVLLIEAVSYLVLCGVATPLYHIWGQHWATRVFGMVHGLLFLLMIWLLMRARFEKRWPRARLWLLFFASLVPVWPFFLDRRLAAWIAATPT